jgi:urease accessory protein
MTHEAVSSQDAAGWRATLELKFERKGARSILAAQSHVGPLLVQRPFYPEGSATCHVYVLHPPGGMVGGARLRIEASVGENAQALVTTPAAGKFYRSAGPEAAHAQVLHIAPGGCLEWLPQETIVYNASRAVLHTEVHLESGARFIGWDVFCLGRPASGETFASGWYRSTLEIWRAGRRLLTERALYKGGAEVLRAPWGLSNYPVAGMLVAAIGADDPGDRLRDAARQAAGPPGDKELFGITRLDSLLVARYLGHHGDAARRKLIAVWQALREGLLGRPVAIPRIWYT